MYQKYQQIIMNISKKNHFHSTMKSVINKEYQYSRKSIIE